MISDIEHSFQISMKCLLWKIFIQVIWPLTNRNFFFLLLSHMCSLYTLNISLLLAMCLGEGNGNWLQYSCLENPMDRGAWWAAVHRVAQSWTQLKWLSMHACIGEGNGNPLQYSCLENPIDRGAWWATIYRVAESRAQLKWLSSSSHVFENIFSIPLFILLIFFFCCAEEEAF